MSNELIKIGDLQIVAETMSKSRLFCANGWATPEQILTLMMICQAEGGNAISAVQRYDNIKGRIYKTSKAMLSDFLSAGGVVEWIKTDDNVAEAKFFAPDGKNKVQLSYTIEQAKKSGLIRPGSGWDKNPEDMLRARLVSKALRMIYPQATSLMPASEEADCSEVQQVFSANEDKQEKRVFEDDKSLQEQLSILISENNLTVDDVNNYLDKIKWGKIADLSDNKIEMILDKPQSFCNKVKSIKENK